MSVKAAMANSSSASKWRPSRISLITNGVRITRKSVKKFGRFSHLGIESSVQELVCPQRQEIREIRRDRHLLEQLRGKLELPRIVAPRADLIADFLQLLGNGGPHEP